jgi:hypothetical protein
MAWIREDNDRGPDPRCQDWKTAPPPVQPTCVCHLCHHRNLEDDRLESRARRRAITYGPFIRWDEPTVSMLLKSARYGHDDVPLAILLSLLRMVPVLRRVHRVLRAPLWAPLWLLRQAVSTVRYRGGCALRRDWREAFRLPTRVRRLFR